MFTSDFYLERPESWLGKKVTLSVAYVEIRNDSTRKDGNRQIDAYTYNQGAGGGWLSILGKPDAVAGVIRQAGTDFRYTGAGTRTTNIHGILSQDEGGKYYLSLDY